MKAFRWILRIFLGLIILIAIVLLTARYSWLKDHAYTPAHAIYEASLMLNNQAEERLKLNQGYLEHINETQHHYKDTTKAGQLFRKARILHQSAHWLADSIYDDSVTLYAYWGTWMEAKSLEELQWYDPKLLESKVIPSKRRMAEFRNRLASFLKLTAPYPKSAATQQQFLKLEKLAALPAESFYLAIYGDHKRYLQFAGMAIIRSAIAGIETECMEHLKIGSDELKGTLFQKTLVPFVSDVPITASAGDSVRFKVRLVHALLMHPALRPGFSFPDGRIDSIKNGSLAFVSFPTGNISENKNAGPGKVWKKNFAITFNYHGRDTILAAFIRVNLRKPQKD